jgi:hypothetical protein
LVAHIGATLLERLSPESTNSIHLNVYPTRASVFTHTRHAATGL